MKKIILPKKIILLDGEYKISYQKDMCNYTKTGEFRSRDLARLFYKDKKIHINKKSKSNDELNFWHELGHHFFNYYNMPNNETSAEAFAGFVLNCIKQLGYKIKNGK